MRGAKIKMFTKLLVTFCWLNSVTSFKRTNIKFNQNTRGYEDIVIVVSEELSAASCPQILDNVKASITEASRALHSAMEGEVYLDKVTIEVPQSWDEMDCRTPLSPACLSPSSRKTGDILIASDHPVHGSFPWTQQSMGCGKPGEFVYLPYSFLAPTNSSQIGKMISNQWMRLRYGIFEDFDPRVAGISVSSQHHAHCLGQTVKNTILAHQDFQSESMQSINFTIPRFTITKQAVPKYVIVLENSQTMNMRDHWDFIRTTCKKFIKHDLPDTAHVGLVLFNDNAHEAYPISMLGPKANPQTRDGLAFSIKNKYNLSPSTGSCVRCGIVKAIESLQTSGSPHGGVLIVISRGGITSLSLNEEKEVMELSQKHNLQIFPVSIPQPPVTDISLSLERLAHTTGGESFFIVDDSYSDKSSLSTYVGLADTFREIQQRTLGNSPSLIYEKHYDPHQEGVYSERGHFIIDKYSGGATEFNVFALKPYNNFLKSMDLQDRRGNMYNSMMDSMANFHIFSIYNVPFKSAQNIGMNWTYSLERLPSTDNINRHTVQVGSSPRNPKEQIGIRLWTNLDSHAVTVSADKPVVIFAEVKLGQAPIVDANVIAEIQAINQSGFLTPVYNIPLYDNGNGDPDLKAHDGIYSRYLTYFPGGEGRYTVNLKLHDNYGKAFAPMKTYGDVSRSCCQDKTYLKISNQKLGSFSRIVKGDSFRIHSIKKGALPPSRIMNLAVDVLTASQQLEFSWTSPGDDFDSGKPTSYQLFYSDYPAAFYTNMKKTKLIESFSASKSAGSNESKKIKVEFFDTNLYYALLAVDKDGNLGQISNVVKAYMPSPIIPGDAIKTSPHSSSEVSGTVVPTDKPSKILLYLIVGIVGFIILCMMVVMVILLSFRRKKLPEDLSLDSNKSHGTSTDNNGFSGASDDIENLSRDQEAKHFLLSNSGQDSLGNGPIHSSLIRDESGSVNDNPYGYIASQHNNHSYGWSATTNPYVYKDNNETYASIASFHNTSQDSYVRGYQPTYAQPIPKNLRPQHIYSNAAVIARHSPQPLALSPQNSQSSADGSRGTVTFQAQTETPILRVSPDSQSSENAPTPTKSILKKPKNNDTTLDMTDRESQSSQASSINPKEEVRSPSATDTVSSQQSQISTITTNEDVNLSIEKTYLETSFEFSPLPGLPPLLSQTKEEAENAANANATPTKKLPPPTLPKPRAPSNQDIIVSTDNLSNSLDKKIRNCTQV